MNPFIQDKTILVSFLIAFVVVCFGVLPKTQSVDPPPGGGYPGSNTAAGNDALFSLPIRGGGHSNTAIGSRALGNNTSGPGNTARRPGLRSVRRTSVLEKAYWKLAPAHGPLTAE